MDNQALSLVTAERLRELREARGFSHATLSKRLKEDYGVDISTASLLNYEVTSKEHSKVYKNNGMRLEYLRCLADFYEVSTDWLLGLSDIASTDMNIQMIGDTLGVSEEFIENLIHMKGSGALASAYFEALEELIRHTGFRFLLININKLQRYALAPESIKPPTFLSEEEADQYGKRIEVVDQFLDEKMEEPFVLVRGFRLVDYHRQMVIQHLQDILHDICEGIDYDSLFAGAHSEYKQVERGLSREIGSVIIKDREEDTP